MINLAPDACLHPSCCTCPPCATRRGLQRIHPELCAFAYSPSRPTCWFTVVERHQTALYSAHTLTLHNRRRVEVDGVIECLCPSPDGANLAFSVFGPQPGVHILYTDSGVVARLTRGKGDFVERWDPDAPTLAVTRKVHARHAGRVRIAVPVDPASVPSLAAPPALYSVADLYELTDFEPRLELVRGRLVLVRPVRRTHRRAVDALVGAVLDYAHESWRGRASSCNDASSPGWILRRKPDSIRFPLAAYVRAKRFGCPQLGDYEGAPDLVIETRRRGEDNTDVLLRMDDYFDAGCSAVWWLDVTAREVTRHDVNGGVHVFSAQSVLEETRLLPGFRCDLADVFDPPRLRRAS